MDSAHKDMNHIEARNAFDHCLNFFVDDYWLRDALQQLDPQTGYETLIPTLLYWLYSEPERCIVWERILPPENKRAICPILMCPDDCDFYCTLVLAEVRNYGHFVQWTQLGIGDIRDWRPGMELPDIGSSPDPSELNADIRWFSDFPELDFEWGDYLQMLQKFIDQFETTRLENEVNNR